MTEVERYKKLKLEIEDVAGKLAGLPGRIHALKTEVTLARDQSIRAELLGDPGAPARQAAIRPAQDDIHRLEAEKEDLEHRREVLRSVLEEVRKRAEPELAAVHTRAFARAVKSFAATLRAAHRAELELAMVREEAERGFGEIDSRLVPLPTLEHLLIRAAGNPEAMRPEVARFFDLMKSQGFDLS